MCIQNCFHVSSQSHVYPIEYHNAIATKENIWLPFALRTKYNKRLYVSPILEWTAQCAILTQMDAVRGADDVRQIAHCRIRLLCIHSITQFVLYFRFTIFAFLFDISWLCVETQYTIIIGYILSQRQISPCPYLSSVTD